MGTFHLHSKTGHPRDPSLNGFFYVKNYFDRAIARSVQQDRGWIFSRTARTVEVSKFFIIWHCTFVKYGKKGHATAKYTKSETYRVKSVNFT